MEDFAQQFSAAQKQTEAFRHILPRRSAAVSTPPPAEPPPSARRRGRPPAASTSRSSSATTAACTTAAAWTGRRRPAQPASAPAKPVVSARAGGVLRRATRSLWILLFRRWWPHHSIPPEEGGWRIFCFLFCFCSATDPRVSGTQNFNKRAVSFSSGSQEGEDGSVRDPRLHTPVPPLSSPVGSRVRSEGVTPSPASPAQLWSQVSVTPHTQTPLRDALPFESGPCAPFRCPTVGTSVTPLVPLVRSLGAWLELPRPSRWLLRTIRLGYAIQFARHPPKFRGIRFTSVLSKDAPVLRAEVAVLLAKDVIEPVPPAEMKSGFYSPYFIVPKKGGGLRPILGPARSEPGPSQAPVQDVDAETHLSMRPSLRLVCSNRPEGRLLPCLDPPSTQTISPLCVRGASIPVQGPSLRAIPVASCLHQGRRSSPCTIKGSRHSYPQLPRRLAHSGPVSSTVVRNTGIWCSVTSAGWDFRSTGKRANSPLRRGSLFSAWSWTRSTSQHVSQRSVLSQCWDAWSLSSARGRFPLKHFQRLLGHMHPQPLSRRSDCFIWDRFSVGFTTGSRDGHGATAHTGSHSPRPAVAPSALGRTLRFFGQECP